MTNTHIKEKMVGSKERFKMVPAVYLVLLRGDGQEVLLLRRANTGYRDGMYSLVAGHVDGNEQATAALLREAEEEAGITLQAKNLRFAHAMHRFAADSERMDLFFAADAWQGEVVNKEPEKCSELDWYSLASLPADTIPYIRHALEGFRVGEYFSEFDERKEQALS